MRAALLDKTMQLLRRLGWTAAMVFGTILLSAPVGNPQSSTRNDNGSQLPRHIPPPSELEDQQLEIRGSPVFYEKRLQVLNAAQHKSMVADTDRLLKLVSDLNAQINSNNSSTLTPDQLRMVAEIEKLAHNVRDKMRISVRSATILENDSEPPFGPR